MNDNIKIWAVDKASKAVKPVQSIKGMETEDLLEKLLAENPSMLMPCLTLVGRQTPTDSGPLDLLGVNEDGRLVVFELKREKLTRDALAQVIDYGSYLESLADPELAKLISDHSGQHGIGKIDDFESWYRDQHGRQLTSLRPVKMVLIAFDISAAAHRMVEFLAERGVDISLITFHGYQDDETRMLLARQTDRGIEARGASSKLSQRDARSRLEEHVKEIGLEDFWKDAVDTLGEFSNYQHVTKNGITFYTKRDDDVQHDADVNLPGSHSVVIDPSGKIRIKFFPRAVDTSPEEFQKYKKDIGFECESPPNAAKTEQSSKQWFCELDEKEWNMHKNILTKLAKNVHEKLKRG
ncbi:MAG: endonuclease NucS [Gammaproteobacteria bacterium]|nr:endonuclease NucS [Gammaproteobacteria bacterium]